MQVRAIEARGVLLGLLLGSLLTGLVGCNRDYEEEEQTVDVGFQGEARTNDLLMVQRWAERLGVEVQARDGWGGPPSRGSVVIADASEWPSASAEADDVLSWIDGGGHLLLCVFGFDDFGNSFWDTGDEDPTSETMLLRGMLSRQPILEELGVEIHERRSLANEYEVAGEAHTIDFPEVPALRTTSVDDVAPRIGSGRRANLLTFEYGAGRVTVVSSGWWMTNEAFVDGDEGTGHPEVLWDLIGPRAQQRGLLLLHGQRPTLWSLLVQRFGAALSAGLALLLLWLWRSWRRFGPVFEVPPPAHRAFHEHVEATGRFLWRQKQGLALRNAFRARVMRRVERTLPYHVTRVPEDLVVALAQRSGLEPGRVRSALLNERFDTSSYTRTIADLQHLRACL